MKRIKKCLISKLDIFWYLCCIPMLLYCMTAQATFIVGHRGARGLYPEGTLMGYKAAISHRVAYIDMDVVMTKDHRFIVYHDLALNPDITRDHNGRWIKKPI